MDLDKVRSDINKIDDELKKNFSDRLTCSARVAQIKLENNDAIYKPTREKQICESFAEDRKYLTFIKKIMQISRIFQYGLFYENGAIAGDFYDSLDEQSKGALEQGGLLSLKLVADYESASGLNAHDILSVIADSSLKIKKLCASEDGVEVCLEVDDDEGTRREALILAYMLYAETTEGIC
ncbi:MAG: chorismate mutase [Clostridium sp.]|nr:chorismate mutase [Clostridium sp.]MCM1399240.1 chorismate mutase [Clostridium sp.]MCM1459729.1 chorismate mutase [Bacteroides sp.]